MSDTINRRKFFKDSAFSAAGVMLGSKMAALLPENVPEIKYSSIMNEVMKYRKIDAHEHVAIGSSNEFIIDFADRLGIEKLVVSKPSSEQDREKATPEEFRKCNDIVLGAMKQYPDRFMGMVIVNPYFAKESLEEIKRCTDNGMVALKVHNQVKINDPLFYPIIEKFIDLKMIILMHASSSIGFGGQRIKYGNIQPNGSIPEDFIEAAKRYPEAMFQFAHTGGGGDWEYECKMLKDFPNIYVDTSGSNNEGNMIDFALKYLGEDRLFFGTDGSYYQGVGDIIASNLTDAQKKKIFFENFNNILKKSGNHVN
jgi:predicted TIM-barrel fold metal-dependent hydrolase